MSSTVGLPGFTSGTKPVFLHANRLYHNPRAQIYLGGVPKYSALCTHLLHDKVVTPSLLSDCLEFIHKLRFNHGAYPKNRYFQSQAAICP